MIVIEEDVLLTRAEGIIGRPGKKSESYQLDLQL